MKNLILKKTKVHINKIVYLREHMHLAINFTMLLDKFKVNSYRSWSNLCHLAFKIKMPHRIQSGTKCDIRKWNNSIFNKLNHQIFIHVVYIILQCYSYDLFGIIYHFHNYMCSILWRFQLFMRMHHIAFSKILWVMRILSFNIYLLLNLMISYAAVNKLIILLCNYLYFYVYLIYILTILPLIFNVFDILEWNCAQKVQCEKSSYFKEFLKLRIFMKVTQFYDLIDDVSRNCYSKIKVTLA